VKSYVIEVTLGHDDGVKLDDLGIHEVDGANDNGLQARQGKHPKGTHVSGVVSSHSLPVLPSSSSCSWIGWYHTPHTG